MYEECEFAQGVRAMGKRNKPRGGGRGKDKTHTRQVLSNPLPVAAAMNSHMWESEHRERLELAEKLVRLWCGRGMSSSGPRDGW
jgi:hypothetical protein